jgi:hypothetical protein
MQMPLRFLTGLGLAALCAGSLLAGTSNVDQAHGGPALKGEHNPNPTRDARDQGGPDGFGYRWQDSSEPEGPVYTWLEISGSGTALSLGDDQASSALALPWSFPFYEGSYSQVFVSSNGFLSFGSGSIAHLNTGLPNAGAPNGLIALFWDDLNPASGGTIYTGTVGNQWVCQFQDVREYQGPGTVKAQIVLSQDGTIVLQYHTLAGGLDIAGETIGLEDPAGARGLTVSLDGSPAAYPANGLAVRITPSNADASLAGVIRDGNQAPVSGATVLLGELETTSGPDGAYLFPACFSGSHTLVARAEGFFDFRDPARVIQSGANSLDIALEASNLPPGLVGHWSFDNPADLLAPRSGQPLQLVGNHTVVAGPTPQDGAVGIGVGSFYRCFHGIQANGGLPNPAWVNRFTIVMDVRLPGANQYRCLYQTNWPNSNDGDCFINPQQKMGITQTGYSDYALEPGDWYRLAIRADLGLSYDYYLDGQLLHLGGPQDFEGRFALYPASGANQVLFFADEDGEDGPIEVAGLWLFDRALSPAELASIGGYGHTFESPVPPYMIPYLQAPTATSMRVGWHSSASPASTVEYGPSPALGQTASGTSHSFAPGTLWHTVKLQNLQPATEYWYRALSDTAVSQVYRFRTLPAPSSTPTHVRFGLLSDNQTEPDIHRQVIAAMKETFIQRYGPDFHLAVDLVLNTGDIVDTGSSLEQYPRMYFNPIGELSPSLPFMTAIGNHEAEAAIFYEYMHHEDYPGVDGQGYYALRVGPVLFLVLNSNIRGATQLAWLQQQLDQAQASAEVQWIFGLLHHPGRSETWPDGNTSWVQDEVIPRLAAANKAEHLFYGHTHAFELGAHPEAPLGLLCFGGAAGHLDRWGQYGNQTDYPEIFRSHDVHGYSVYEIDLQNGTLVATAYTLGHEDQVRDNQLLAVWSRQRNQPAPAPPQALHPGDPAHPVDTRPWLVSSGFEGTGEWMSSQFQLIAEGGSFNTPLLDRRLDWSNVYGDTGSPLWEPVDLNQGLDLSRLRVPAGLLSPGQDYRWRVRHRDRNLLWSPWTAATAFTAGFGPAGPDVLASPTSGPAPLEVRFTDLSGGEPLAWSWDFDGDGLEDSSERDPLYTYGQAGLFSPALTVSYGDGSQTRVWPGLIQVELPVPEVEITLEGGTVRLQWPPLPGALYYRVYGSPDGFGPFLPEAGGEITDTFWQAPLSLGRRCWQVRAVFP